MDVWIKTCIDDEGNGTSKRLDPSLWLAAQLLAETDVCVPEDAIAAKLATSVLEAKDKFKVDVDDPIVALILDFEDQEAFVTIGSPTSDEYELARCLVKSTELDTDHWAQYVEVTGLPGFTVPYNGAIACSRCEEMLPDPYAHECAYGSGEEVET